MKNYKEFTIITQPNNPEIVSGVLWELDIDGLNEFDDRLVVYASEEKSVSEEKISKILDKLTKENLIESYEVRQASISDKNWNTEWEKTIQVIEVSDRIVIKPSFREYNAKPDQIVITIDPKMSFGTGEHESTKLVLHLLEQFLKEDDVVLDVGSGTGVLSIASVLLGAERAVAIDNSEWCYENAIENSKLNGVEDKIEILEGEIDLAEKRAFDIVVANINKNVLLDIAKKLRSRLKPDGMLILSGILIKDSDDIINHYTELGFRFFDEKQMNEWIAIGMKL
jgi:ribosomal protein L11 methyltransferase